METLSSDAIAREKAAPRPGARTTDQDSESSQPSDQELVYQARVALDSTQMNVDGKLVNLSPGMAVTVEIKTGRRRIISYLLSPLLKFKQEALRER